MADSSDSWGRSSKALINLRALYLCSFMAFGAYLPFINLYYERIGLSGVQIGSLAAIPSLVGGLASLFWGALSDRFHLHGRILSLALLLAPLAIFLISETQEFTWLVVVIFTYAIISSPILPLMDSQALEEVKTQRATFGGLRVYGSFGWSIATVLVGILIGKYSIQLLFYACMVMMLCSFALSIFLPARRIAMESSLTHGLRKLLRPEILVFLSSMLLLGMAMTAMNAFLSIYLDSIGTAEGYIGVAWALASLSEMPMMIYFGAIVRRFGAGRMLKLAFVTLALRTLLMSFIQVPVWALILQLSHGLFYPAFMIGGVTYINERTPVGMSTTAQALFSAVTYGIGAMFGVFLSGFLYDQVGLAIMFRILSLLAFTGLVVFWLGSSRMQPIKREETIGA